MCIKEFSVHWPQSIETSRLIRSASSRIKSFPLIQVARCGFANDQDPPEQRQKKFGWFLVSPQTGNLRELPQGLLDSLSC